MIRTYLVALGVMYSPQFIRLLTQWYAEGGHRLDTYMRRFMAMKPETLRPRKRLSAHGRRNGFIIAMSWLGLGTLFVVAGMFGVAAISLGHGELWWFAAALVFAWPLFAAFSVPLFDWLFIVLSSIRRPKKAGREFVCWRLESQVVRLRKRHDFRIVAVAGSMGKTSTKYAVAKVLESAGLRVRYQAGNYNDRVTVPLVIFGHELPNLLRVGEWMRLFRANETMIRADFPYDVVVVELGTDRPGQMEQFGYIKPDMLIMTAIAPEHMEYFGSIEAVAREEMSIVPYAGRVLVNHDDIPGQYLPADNYMAYSVTDRQCAYFAEAERIMPDGQELNFYKTNEPWMTQYVSFLGAQGRKIVLAAAAAADMLGVERQKIAAGLSALKPMAGRMQLLEGKHGSVLIDDTYNATPAAVEAAVAVLESLPATKRVAILGNMNELGDFSAEAHRTIGASLDAEKTNLVITIGGMARDYLAPAAEEKGCTVRSVMNPHEAGEMALAELQEGAVVLIKGSQNGVFSEEAIKPLLKHEADTQKLVRQSAGWMKKKRAQFTLP